jgi:hypothetical protein
MEEFKTLYPKVAHLIADIPCSSETFLFDRTANIEYPFWAELEYFLSNRKRLGNTRDILRKLSSAAPLTLEANKAWQRRQDFRSAQFEVSVIFLIERYFGGKTRLIPEDRVPTPDFEVEFNQGKFKIEAKAQSGQHHGDKHPRHHGPILFDPKEEIDLRSWLFEERISSRNGKAMEPQVTAAEKKGADILACVTDYIETEEDLLSQISILCPESEFTGRITLQSANRKPIDALFFQATYPCLRQPTKVKEIWLCDLSRSGYGLVVLSRTDAILSNHLKCRR